MDTSTIFAIAIPVLVFLAALVLFTTVRRRDTDRAISGETVRKDRSDSPFLAEEEAERPKTGREIEREVALARASSGTELERFDSGPPTPYVPPDPETLGVTRRQYLNRSIVAMFGLSISGFGAAVLAFLWPTLSGGFGSEITVGSVDNILGSIRDTREPFYVAEGRFYINPYPTAAVEAARNVYSDAVLGGMEEGVIALYQKCPHLGCRVPWCETSQWFECGCHGSQYSRVGEYKGGPAPRGLDLFGVNVSGGVVSVDTSLVIEGAPVGTNTTGQEAEGPNCVGGGGDH
jgi:cytochrome b6-f complex iron-sulfur subunit